MDRKEWKCHVDELKAQWRLLWRDRIDDKVRAEGIANKDYSSLFVERGTVIVASRDCKPPDFNKILEEHKPVEIDMAIPPNPLIGGWGKFAKTMLSMQKHLGMRGRRQSPPEPKDAENRQRKKGGRGWLHFRMK